MEKIILKTNESLQNALDFAAKSSSGGVLIQLEDGIHKGIEKNRLFYDSAVPLKIIGNDMNTCILRGENCEFYHKDTENRAVLTFGENCTRVELCGFSIENAHIKTAEDKSLGNQAESLCWHNNSGFLKCENMRFSSRQDTIHTKGFAHFENCKIEGDVDFIWGYCDTVLFERCQIITIRDNRGDGRPAYVLQSRAKNSKPGFIFENCEFLAEDRGENAALFVARSSGTGKIDSADRWDSVALLDCTISSRYDCALWTDEDGTRAVFPEKGNALCGWREFGTKIKAVGGEIFDYDSKLQEKHGATISKNDAELLRKTVRETLAKFN